MVGEDFYYDGEWLSSYDLQMCDPESDQEFIERVVERSEITPIRSIPNHFSVAYSDTKVINFLIIKDMCKLPDQNDMPMTGDQINEIRAWLESSKQPSELIVNDCDHDYTVHYFGVFTSVQPYVVASMCYGLQLTFQCNAPYGFSDEFSDEFTVSNSSGIIERTIRNYSAERREYLNPVITINSSTAFGSGETVTITNISDDNNAMVIELPSMLSKLIIDCSKKIVTDASGNLIPLSEIGLSIPEAQTYNFITADSFDYYWLRLLPDKNDITVQCSAGNHVSTVDISGRFIMKTGGF